jgi:hypothetical protein
MAQHSVKLESDTAVLEQPLAVALHLRPADAAQSEVPVACVQVDLRYGEFDVPPGQIHVSTQPVPGSGHVRIAVSSALLVNEPLVHLRLTVTCEPRLQQQWTLFADPAPPPGPPRTAMPDGQWLDSAAGIAALAGGGRTAAADPVPVPGAAPARHAAGTRTARKAAGARPAATRKQAGRAVARPATARAGSAPAARLQLGPAPEPAEFERLVEAVLAVLQRHPSAALPAGLPDPLHGELRQLRLEYEQLQATTAALRAQVERLQPPAAAPAAWHWSASARWVAREMLPWMALLPLVALLVWMLLRHKRSGDDPLEGVDLDRARPPSPRRTAGPPPQRGHARNLRHTPQHDPTARPPSTPPSVASALPGRHLELPRAPADTFSAATVEHTLPADMRQQLEQLIRAGDLDSAMILLEFHLSQESGKSAPMLLALLDIYQQRREAAEAARVARQLNSLFNVRGPAAGPDDGSGLEAHPATMRSIVAQWDGPNAREVLKNLMLRPTAVEELQLSAFRDVLALYELAGLRDGQPPLRHAAGDAPARLGGSMPDGALDTTPAHAADTAPW